MSLYRVILADPPWQGYGAAHMRSRPKNRALPSNHYATLNKREIAALPVAEQAAQDSVLLLWATTPRLPEAFEVMKAWGFEYVTTAFAWVKTGSDGDIRRPALGAYTKQNIELCLLGKRGKPHTLRKARDVGQIILARPREHSRKPDEQYGRIMRLFDGPYLEMFARQAWPGWDTWGNQTGLFPAQPFLFGEQIAI